jgi:methionyl-tRNA synthetase
MIDITERERVCPECGEPHEGGSKCEVCGEYVSSVEDDLLAHADEMLDRIKEEMVR